MLPNKLLPSGRCNDIFTRHCCLWDQMTANDPHPCSLLPSHLLFLHTQLGKEIEVNIPVLEIKPILAPQCHYWKEFGYRASKSQAYVGGAGNDSRHLFACWVAYTKQIGDVSLHQRCFPYKTKKKSCSDCMTSCAAVLLETRQEHTWVCCWWYCYFQPWFENSGSCISKY